MLISRNHENLCLRLMEHAGKVIFGQGFPQICPILDHKNIFFGTFLRNRRTESVLQSCMSHLKTCRPSKMMNIFYFQYFLSYSGLNFLFWPSVTRSLYGVLSTVANCRGGGRLHFFENFTILGHFFMFLPDKYFFISAFCQILP